MSLITVEISTKNRYEVLCLALMSICQQSYKPTRLIIFDDSDLHIRTDLRQLSIYKNIFFLLEKNKVQWEIRFTEQRGQVRNHIEALDLCKTKYIFRMDDDCVLSNNTLEVLLNVIEKDDKIGAVGCFVEHPDIDFPESITSPFIEDVLFKYAIQFHKFEGIKETQHLYSTFLSRVSAAKNCYPTNLSKISHREESTFSTKLKRKGYKLLVTFDSTILHMRASEGGIRVFNKNEDAKMWYEDDLRFKERLKAWEINLTNWLPVVCNEAVGDHFILKSIIPEIKQKNPNSKIFLGTVFPDIWWDMPDLNLSSIAGARILLGDISRFNPYRYGYENDGKISLLDCYKKIYNLI